MSSSRRWRSTESAPDGATSAPVPEVSKEGGRLRRTGPPEHRGAGSSHHLAGSARIQATAAGKSPHCRGLAIPIQADGGEERRCHQHSTTTTSATALADAAMDRPRQSRRAPRGSGKAEATPVPATQHRQNRLWRSRALPPPFWPVARPCRPPTLAAARQGRGWRGVRGVESPPGHPARRQHGRPTAAKTPGLHPPPEATLVGGLPVPVPLPSRAEAGQGAPDPEQEDADPALEGADPVLEWQPASLDLEACRGRKKERWRLELLRGSLLAPRQAAVAELKKVATAA